MHANHAHDHSACKSFSHACSILRLSALHAGQGEVHLTAMQPHIGLSIDMHVLSSPC